MVKSCVIGQGEGMSALLQSRNTALGLPLAKAFKDLGVAQGNDKEGKALLRKQWGGSTQRMAFISRLAVDFGGRGKFLANSAMAAGAYGAAAGPVTLTTATWLRKWAVHAVWRGGAQYSRRPPLHHPTPALAS